MRHVVVTKGDRVAGVLRVNTGLRQGLAETGAGGGATLGELATRNFVIARGDEVMFDVIRRIWRRNGFMAVVVGKERGDAARRRRARRHHQGPRRQLGGGQHRDLSRRALAGGPAAGRDATMSDRNTAARAGLPERRGV